MNNYNSIDDILSSTNLTEVTGVDSDEGVFKVKGAPWFKFKGIACENVYFCGNSWFGLGSQTEHLRVNRRDARSKQFWYEEGTMYGVYSFMRYVWYGWQHYNASSSPLKYDVILFSTGDIFLNVATPSSDKNFSYSGTSSLACSRTISYDLYGTANRQFSFYHLDELGNDFELKYEKINIQVPYQQKWLVAKSTNDVIENVYCVRDGALFDLGVVELTSQLFLDNGSDEPISDVLSKDIQNCTVLFWNDASIELKPSFVVKSKQLPDEQILYSANYSFNDETIFAISGIQVQSTDDVMLQVSFDDGVVWSIYDGTSWVSTLNTVDGQWMSKTEFETITKEQWDAMFEKKMIKLSMKLSNETSLVNFVRIKYANA